MTYHPDSVLVEKVAKALWNEQHPHTPWVDPPFPSQEIERDLVRAEARAALRVACPLVAGVIANRLDEMIDATPNVEPAFARGRDAVVNVIRGEFVRSEFVDGEA